MRTRSPAFLLLVLVAGLPSLPACRTLRMGRDVPRDLLGLEPEEDEGWVLPPGPVEAGGAGSQAATSAEAMAALPSVGIPLVARPLTSEGTSSDGSWDADGAQIIFSSIRPGGVIENPSPQTWMMDADGGRQRRISMGIGATGSPGFVSILARQVFYGSTQHTGETPALPPGRRPQDMDLYRQDLDAGSIDRLTDSPGFDGEAAWCRGSETVVFTSLRGGDADLYLLEPGWEPVRLTFDPADDGDAAFSPDCERLAWTRDGALLVGPLTGGPPTVLVSRGVSDPSWHPDGGLVVFSFEAEPGGQADLFAISPAGGSPIRLTATPSSERGPAFAPDGGTLLFSWDRDGTGQVFLAPWEVDGSALPAPSGQADPPASGIGGDPGRFFVAQARSMS